MKLANQLHEVVFNFLRLHAEVSCGRLRPFAKQLINVTRCKSLLLIAKTAAVEMPLLLFEELFALQFSPAFLFYNCVLIMVYSFFS